MEKRNIKTPQTPAQPSPGNKQEDMDEEMMSETDSSSSSETDSEEDQTIKEKNSTTETARDDETPEDTSSRSQFRDSQSMAEKNCIRDQILTVGDLVNERENLRSRLRRAEIDNTRLDKIEDVITKVAKVQVETNRAPQKQMTYAEKLRSPGTYPAEIKSAASPPPSPRRNM